MENSRVLTGMGMCMRRMDMCFAVAMSPRRV